MKFCFFFLTLVLASEWCAVLPSPPPSLHNIPCPVPHPRHPPLITLIFYLRQKVVSEELWGLRKSEGLEGDQRAGQTWLRGWEGLIYVETWVQSWLGND